MRKGMQNKPLDYPREYFEVHCTTAQKAALEFLRIQGQHKTLSDTVQWHIFHWIEDTYSRDGGIGDKYTEQDRIDYWIARRENVLAGRKESGTSANFLEYLTMGEVVARKRAKEKSHEE